MGIAREFTFPTRVPDTWRSGEAEPKGGLGSKNLFPNFGTLSGEPVQRSDTNPHLGSDPLPPNSLRAQRGISLVEAEVTAASIFA
jgi:hypothetical protein